MANIYALLDRLAETDKRLFNEARTALRKVYLQVHQKTVGVDGWHANDDIVLDTIDSALADMFQRAGRDQTRSTAVAKSAQG